jgi:hypothetical protein
MILSFQDMGASSQTNAIYTHLRAYCSLLRRNSRRQRALLAKRFKLQISNYGNIDEYCHPSKFTIFTAFLLGSRLIVRQNLNI